MLKALKKPNRPQRQETDLNNDFDNSENNLEMVSTKKRWGKSRDFYYESNETTPTIEPGVYTCYHNEMYGWGLKKVESNASKDVVLKLNNKKCDFIVNDVVKFWENEDKYVDNDISYKRGILLHGPTGTGKTFLVKRIIQELITKHKGIVISGDNPSSFIQCINIVKRVQPNLKVIFLLEDFDKLLRDYSESTYLQIFDGIHDVHGMVTIVTTNSIQDLHERLSKRPGRFDIIEEIDVPEYEDRLAYLNHVGRKSKLDSDIIQELADKSKNYTFGHLRELYVSIIIQGYSVEMAINRMEEIMGVSHTKKLRSTSSVGFSGK